MFSTAHIAPKQPPREQARGRGWLAAPIWLRIGLALGVLVALASCEAGTSTTQSPATTRPPATTLQQHHRVGDQVKAGNIWVVTVNSAMLHTGNATFAPKAGSTFLVIDETLKNASSREQDVSSLLMFTLKDATGQQYTESFTGVVSTGANAPDGKVEAGGLLRGQIVFEVPTVQHQFTFAFQPSVTSGDQTLWDITNPQVAPLPTATVPPTPAPTEVPKAPPTAAPRPAPTATPQPAAPANLTLAFGNVEIIHGGTGVVSVKTHPGAALTIRVHYLATNRDATSKSLDGTNYADEAGNYTWRWSAQTSKAGTARVTVTATWNGQSKSIEHDFPVG